jgi:glutamate synthase (NADPH/NADH) large chain
MTLPSADSLWSERFERDSCGFGLIAHLHGEPSHRIVATAVEALERLTHRGAVAADGLTGDGCGLLMSRPEAYLTRVAAAAGIQAPDGFAAGMLFLNPGAEGAARARRALERILREEGVETLGWREMPVDESVCGEQALRSLPQIEQIFLARPDGDTDAQFNRRLYMARRRAEIEIENKDPVFYVASLSCTTLAFKAMVMPAHLTQFYTDLASPDLEAAICVFHQRFSTNTWPQWRLAQPFRYLAHNGEINTIQGNRNWAAARVSKFETPLLPRLKEVAPLVSLSGSDSCSLDNMVEVLLQGGMDLMQAMRLLIPPAWQTVDTMDPDVRAFYEYYGMHLEPWDGPAGIVLTDGKQAACCLDRNGLRPARYVITDDEVITIASEIGVYDYRPEQVVSKGRLGPGQMLLIDTENREILDTQAIEDRLKVRAPYKEWLRKGVSYLDSELIDPQLSAEPMERDQFRIYQKMFNVTREERDEVLRVLAETEAEAVGSMGDDTPLPPMSSKIRVLYDYFRQQFAQVTNPPIDPLRERIVMSLETQIGPELNVFEARPENARRIVMNSPVLSQRKFRQILRMQDGGSGFRVIDLNRSESQPLEDALGNICAEAEAAVRDGCLIVILSDRDIRRGDVPVHAMLATGAVHHHLVASGLRCDCNLVVETATARDPHHFACLIGYGATAVYPYLAYECLLHMTRTGELKLDRSKGRQLG